MFIIIIIIVPTYAQMSNVKFTLKLRWHYSGENRNRKYNQRTTNTHTPTPQKAHTQPRITYSATFTNILP
jgi:hypothetical protein